jgi:hypothetical protein
LAAIPNKSVMRREADVTGVDGDFA